MSTLRIVPPPVGNLLAALHTGDVGTSRAGTPMAKRATCAGRGCMSHVRAAGVLAIILAASSTSSAQNQGDDLCPFPARAVEPGMIVGGSYAPSGYHDRWNMPVYDIGIPSVSGGDFRGSGTNVYDDVTFPPDARINGAIAINGFAIGFIVPSTATILDDHLYSKFSFFPNHDNTVAADAAPFSGTPVTVNVDWGARWYLYAGFITYYRDL